MTFHHIPADIKQRIQFDIMNQEKGIDSVSITDTHIEVVVKPNFPLPTAREVVVGSFRIPIKYIYGQTYSLASPQLMELMMQPQREMGWPSAYQAEAAADNPTCRICPFDTIRGGISIGHRRITAGTLGGFVFFNEDNRWAILSNNHVMANVNNAAKGDDIVQPGMLDAGSTPPRVVAKLERFTPIKFLASESDVLTPLNVNHVDCALARPVAEVDKTRNIIDIGFPQGARDARLGMAAQKSGRTTKTNSDSVRSISTTLKVNYGTDASPKFAGFTDLIEVGPIVLPGDSGSMLLDNEGYAIGLVFAATLSRDSTGKYIPIKGYACKIGRVASAMSCSVLRKATAADPVGQLGPQIMAGMFMGSVGGGFS